MSISMEPEEPLHEFYNRTFENLEADTEDLKKECFKLRHQVYCVENTFLPQSSDGLERNGYEESSIHILLRHRSTGVFVGTARLVPPYATTNYALPYLKICQDTQSKLPLDFDPIKVTEISRFAISKHVKRRMTTTSNIEIAVTPFMALGLIAGVYQATIKHGLNTTWAAVMEPALPRLLSRLGIHFVHLSPVVQYHGWRRASYIKLQDVEASVMSERPDLLPIFKPEKNLNQI